MAELSSSPSSPLKESSESSKMSCHDCSAPAEKPPSHSPSGRAHRLISTLLPEGFALLSCSCCWLPVCSIQTCTYKVHLYSNNLQTLLDLVFAGSVSAVGVQKLRFFFLAVSVLTLSVSIAREGFSRGNIRRAVICAGLLAWTQYSQRSQGHHGCH